nr:hypothetical protein [Tanacetum cinerariifolium]
VDKKRIVITEEVVHEILQLNDAEGVICLPNDEIFAGLAQMGVGKGFSGVETPLFENMLAVRAVDIEEEVQVPAQDDVVQKHVIGEIATEVLDKCSALVFRVEGLENTNAAQQLEIIKLKARDAEIEGRHANKQAEIYNIDLDHSLKVLSMQEDTEVQEAVEVVTTAKLITEVVTTAATQVVAASAPIPTAKPKTLKIAAAPAVSIRKRKGVVIRDPEEELHTDTLAETPTVKDKGKGILIEDPKPMKKKDQTREEMEKEDKEIIKSINETPVQKAAKRRKLSEEAQEADDLRRRLEIVQDEDDDVFVEAI